ncbi:hypothetical protein BEI02_16775 [Elizabethkingia sp. HvH-WGS333]|nr:MULTISPECIES: hypothetical protein [Elizabethkingia]MCP1253766.1 hypothetical protein [Elizabethkingia sp. S0634]MDV2446195.1 hypothetical protein [Elizabethkingia anophelis]MDX8573548.1 hypothetical protein [Elizabethkingia sp. HX QKY]OIK45817.1 hypothetical protein BEI02_16775 [Elizabethkingia sp. HvH-WGS333]
MKKLTRKDLKISFGGKLMPGGIKLPTPGFDTYCQTYAMVLWCSNETATDTICYNRDNQSSKDYAYECMRSNNRLWNVYKCGSEDYGG